jgi:hypothetical protein
MELHLKVRCSLRFMCVPCTGLHFANLRCAVACDETEARVGPYLCIRNMAEGGANHPAVNACVMCLGMETRFTGEAT